VWKPRRLTSLWTSTACYILRSFCRSRNNNISTALVQPRNQRTGPLLLSAPLQLYPLGHRAPLHRLVRKRKRSAGTKIQSFSGCFLIHSRRVQGKRKAYIVRQASCHSTLWQRYAMRYKKGSTKSSSRHNMALSGQHTYTAPRWLSQRNKINSVSANGCVLHLTSFKPRFFGRLAHSCEITQKFTYVPEVRAASVISVKE
jgi:hypothetical protein